MSKRTLPGGVDRHSYTKTHHRGLSYRLQANGSRRYYGYLSGRGRVPLQATAEREAVAEYGNLRGKVGRGERVIVPSKLKIADVGSEHLADAQTRLRSTWAKDYKRIFERVIESAWGHRAVSSITPQDVLRLDRELRSRGLSEATVANYMKPARGMFDYAVLQGYIAINPFAQVPRGRLSSCNQTREHREWTTKEVLALIAAAYALDARPEARAEYGLAIEMKLRTGSRLGELLGARYGEIDFEHGIWRITAQWTKDGILAEPKTKKSVRRVPLAPQLVKKIAARKLRLGAGDADFVFASRKGGFPISQTNFRRRGWNPAIEGAKLTDGPKVTPHDARHAFASEMAERGLASIDVAEVLGHTSVGITERIYTHAFNRDEREERVRQAISDAMSG